MNKKKILPFENPAFVFIGGAPRSGTTLLSNLLDGHREALVFPKEHATLERYFWNKDSIEEYARSKFIHSRSEGQQTILANRKFYDEKQGQLKTEFGKRFDFEINCDLFKQAYLEYLLDRSANLENILGGLAYALISARNGGWQNAHNIRCFVLKQPFFTELFAQETLAHVRNCKFIHLLRDPFSRYVSAKTRRLRHLGGSCRRLGSINRRSYVVGHSTIDAATRSLALKNSKEIGAERYRVLKFEDLVSNPRNVLQSLLDWIGIDSKDFEVMPTRMGVPTDSTSSLSQGFKVDNSASNRMANYESMTSVSERYIHRALLSTCREYPQNLDLFWKFIPPLPKSNWKNYFFQLCDAWRSLSGGDFVDVEGFLRKAREGRAMINGAT